MKKKGLFALVGISVLAISTVVLANEDETNQNGVEFETMSEDRWEYEYIVEGEKESKEQTNEEKEMIEPPSLFENHYSLAEVDVRKNEMLDAVNGIMAGLGMEPLTLDDAYSQAAMAKAKDMYYNQYFEKNSPTHGTPKELVEAHGHEVQEVSQWIQKGDGEVTELIHKWFDEQSAQEKLVYDENAKYGFGIYGEKGTEEVYWVLLKITE